MKNISLLQKIVAILMTVIIMIEFTGCYSKKYLSTSDINQSDTYLIHSKKSTYTVYNMTISEGTFSGELDFNNKNFSDIKYANIYLTSDSALIINNDQINFPVYSISEVTQKVPDPAKTKSLKTFLIVAGVISVTVSVLGIIAMIRLANDLEKCTAEQFDIMDQSCSGSY